MRVPEAVQQLPMLAQPDRCCALVASDASTWAPFRRALTRDPVLRRSLDPFDDYTERVVRGAAARLPDARIAWSHRHPPAFPIASLAAALGATATAPCRLAVDAVRGPWLGLRAVIVWRGAPPAELPARPAPCDGCAAPCAGALERAMRSGTDAAAVRRNWRFWTRVREVCPVGRHARYGAEQLRYHYTADRTALLRLAGEHGDRRQ